MLLNPQHFSDCGCASANIFVFLHAPWLQPVQWIAPPLGSKDCPVTKWGMCNNVGNCNYDTGYCECTAGWKGPSCETIQKRPCTDGYRDPNSEDPEPRSHIDKNKRDLDLTKYGWSYSRCSGGCYGF